MSVLRCLERICSALAIKVFDVGGQLGLHRFVLRRIVQRSLAVNDGLLCNSCALCGQLYWGNFGWGASQLGPAQETGCGKCLTFGHLFGILGFTVGLKTRDNLWINNRQVVQQAKLLTLVRSPRADRFLLTEVRVDSALRLLALFLFSSTFLLPEGLAAALILVTMEVMPVDFVGGAIISNKCFSFQIGDE